MAEKKRHERSLKQKIRDTKRLLAREEIPETVRLTKERVLRSLQQELRGRQQDKKGRKIAKKYRMIRFFEKRKVARLLKSRLKELSSSTDESERSEVLDDIHRLKRELNYIEHYPAGEKYIALYPSAEGTSTKALEKREKILSQIADWVDSGELPDATGSEAKTNENENAVAISISEGKKDSLYMKDMQAVTQRPISEDVQRSHYSSKNVPVRGGRTFAGTKRVIAPVDDEPDSDDDLTSKPKKLSLEDDFFLQDSTSEDSNNS